MAFSRSNETRPLQLDELGNNSPSPSALSPREIQTNVDYIPNVERPDYNDDMPSVDNASSGNDFGHILMQATMMICIFAIMGVFVRVIITRSNTPALLNTGSSSLTAAHNPAGTPLNSPIITAITPSTTVATQNAGSNAPLSGVR